MRTFTWKISWLLETGGGALRDAWTVGRPGRRTSPLNTSNWQDRQVQNSLPICRERSVQYVLVEKYETGFVRWDKKFDIIKRMCKINVFYRKDGLYETCCNIIVILLYLPLFRENSDIAEWLNVYSSARWLYINSLKKKKKLWRDGSGLKC